MDSARFDRLVRTLVAAPRSRRGFLVALAGGLAMPALVAPSVAEAKHHHKKACTGGAVRCGKGCCAADDHCVNGTCYCAPSAGAEARAASACTPMPACAAHREVDQPCGYGDLGPCFCQRTVAREGVCVYLDLPICGCTQDADCKDGYVCVPDVPGCGNACLLAGAPFCLPGGPA